jgi:hypothetical protein
VQRDKEEYFMEFVSELAKQEKEEVRHQQHITRTKPPRVVGSSVVDEALRMHVECSLTMHGDVGHLIAAFVFVFVFVDAEEAELQAPEGHLRGPGRSGWCSHTTHTYTHTHIHKDVASHIHCSTVHGFSHSGLRQTHDHMTPLIQHACGV